MPYTALRNKQSISRRLLMQTLAFGIFLLVFMMGTTFQILNSQSETAMQRRALSVLYSVQNLLDIHTDPGLVQYAVKKIGIEEGIALVLVINDKDRKIIASSKPEWYGKNLIDVGANPEILREVEEVMKTREIEVGHPHFEDKIFEAAVPVYMKTKQPGKLETGVAYLALDTTVIHEEMVSNLWRFAMTIFSSVVAFCAFLLYFFRKDIFTPLEYIRAAVEKRAQGDKKARAFMREEDEIGVLASSFNMMMSDLLRGEEKLERARHEAEKATKLKSEFLAMMSHEIRTPMNGVLGMMDLLMETELDKTQKKFARTAMHSAHALLEIISDILDFSKIEAGHLKLEYVSMDLADTLRHLVDLFQSRARDKGVTLEVTFDPLLPDRIQGDPVRIGQIVSNLISNAIKFTEKGSVTVRVLAPDKRHIRIEVQDTGIGIPEDVQARIFDKFTQADNSTTRKYGGTGLGLSICKQLARMMGGDVGLRSAPQKGSLFWATFAFDPADDMGGVANGTKEKTKPILDVGLTHGLSVLVAEDNAINQEFVLQILQDFGCAATLVRNGKEAVAEVTSGKTFDVILMDCQMPEMDGYDATKEILSFHAAKGTPCPPIIAATANAMKTDKQKCLDAGMCDYLPKPFLKNDVLMKLLKWSGKTQAETKTWGNVPEKEKQESDIDQKALSDMKDLMGDKYKEIIQKYITTADDLMQKLERLVASDAAAQELVIHAHSLKSSSNYLGARILGDAAREMELAAKEAAEKGQNAAVLGTAFDKMSKAWQKIRSAYEQEIT